MVAEHLPPDTLRMVEATVLAQLKTWAREGRDVFLVYAPRGRYALVYSLPEGFRVERVVNAGTMRRLYDLGLIEWADDDTILDLVAGMVTTRGTRLRPHPEPGRKITLTDKGNAA